MDTTKTNPAVTVGVSAQDIGEDSIYTVIRNVTKNQKVVLSTLGGIEVPPGATLNLREMFRKAQLLDATQEIHHFIRYGALEDLSGKPVVLPQTEQGRADIQKELQEKVNSAKTRELLNEINGCTLLSRLEDILSDSSISAEAMRAAKVRYMQLRGWVDDYGVLIEGSAGDDNQDITSIDSWEFEPMKLSKPVIV
jgi:hypothetical protein